MKRYLSPPQPLTIPQLEQAEQVQRIRAAVGELPGRMAVMAMLALVEGRTNGEVAAELGLTRDTVRVYLVRARRRLREMLEENTTNTELRMTL